MRLYDEKELLIVLEYFFEHLSLRVMMILLFA